MLSTNGSETSKQVSQIVTPADLVALEVLEWWLWADKLSTRIHIIYNQRKWQLANRDCTRLSVQKWRDRHPLYTEGNKAKSAYRKRRARNLPLDIVV